MSSLLNIFSTREIAVFIWFIIYLIIISVSKDVRRSIVCAFKAFFQKKLFLAFCTLLMYVLLVVYSLEAIGVWNMSLLKDTIFWTLFSGFVLFLNINKVANENFFSKLMKDNIKIIAIWEFLFNFFTLNLIGELLLIPSVFIVSNMKAFAENFSIQGDDYAKVIVLCKNILRLIGLGLIVYVLYKTMTEYELLFSIANGESFLLPFILVILTFPYFYGLALYINYESYINVVKDKGLIIATFKYANVKLNTLKRIWKYQVHFDSSKDTPDEYIRSIARRPKYCISDKAKLSPFNDIWTVIKNLSSIGIGKLDQWHKLTGDSDGYVSMVFNYQFGLDDNYKIPNALAFFLKGEETYIKQLDIVLDFGCNLDKYQAVGKLIDVLELTFNSLNILISDDLINSIIENREYNVQYDTHSVLFGSEKFDIIEKYTVKIISKIN